MIRRALYRGFSAIAGPKIKAIVAASKSPRESQTQRLIDMVERDADTAFGREHGFGLIRSVEDFQRAVPIREYEQISPYIERATQGEKNVLTAQNPLMFATTSGTTAKPKYIPITPQYMEEFRQASVVSGFHLYQTYPQLDRGVALSVVSPAQEGLTEGGIPYGAISGQLFQHEPFLVKRFISPIPYEVFLIADYENRYYTLLRLALVLPLSFFYTLNPSTINLLMRRLRQHAPQLIADIRKGSITPPSNALDDKTLKAIKRFLQADPERADVLQYLLDSDQWRAFRIWPTLSLVSCWTKAAAAYYLTDFPQEFGDIPVCDITYGASEGRGTVFMGPGQQMLALQSHFFEFVPESEMGKPDAPVLLADQLLVGQNYFILFTTSSGLYRYNINDVVRVTGMYNRTPCLEFQYKGGNVSSFTGEKITELQVTTAVLQAERDINTRLRFFTVIPEFRPEPHYEIWAEPEHAHADAATLKDFAMSLSRAVDRRLSEINIEYATKRESARLSDVTARVLESGGYEAFRRHLTASGVADAQIKVSHLNPKEGVKQFFADKIQL